ncbi:hypothetical protein [Halioglobus sp. HI00S01]|uniref:hypothetical protein n=1 Tax=Halioglobus sp. HI00S01 TaxID=1822214 RepID=UPI001E30728A|nr:hypothetical protein [Halioglobus sp. HI00S01]
MYQDFVVPAEGVDSASFNFDYYASNSVPINSDAFTTFVNNPGGSNNGMRIDILSPADNVFSGTVLFGLFAPTDGSPVGLPTALVANAYPDPAALAAFLNSQAGNTLRLRLGHREESFPWNTGFDNINLDITAASGPVEPPRRVPVMPLGALGLMVLGVLALVRRRLTQR